MNVVNNLVYKFSIVPISHFLGALLVVFLFSLFLGTLLLLVVLDPVSRGQEILEQTGPPLLRNVDLVLEVSTIRRLCVLDLPAQIFNLCLQLCLLVFEQFLPGTRLHIISVRIGVL